tara:strand:+ start:127 stop:375 length:249 start_codon:yes stop_codon:yes gene_type:complete
MRAPLKRDGSKFSLEESTNIVKKGERLMEALGDLLPVVLERVDKDEKMVVQVNKSALESLIELGGHLDELTDLMDLRSETNK